MINKIQHMTKQDKQLKNLFPEAMQKVAAEIFGEQSMQPVLLGLLAAPTSATADLQPQADLSFRKMLHPKEAATLNGYKFPKRRSEYLTGRICAKMAIRELLNLTTGQSIFPILSEIEIARTENGRPDIVIHVSGANALKMEISISHSGDYGVAIAAESPCGVDLQLQQANLLRVQEKFCSEREYSLLEMFLTDSDKIARLALLWAAKEAAKKALSYWQMPGFLDLEVQKLTNLSNCFGLSLRISPAKCRPMPEEVSVVAGMFGESAQYALAICLINEEHSNAGITRS
jgi:phosphopantetheinyl transferase